MVIFCFFLIDKFDCLARTLVIDSLEWVCLWEWGCFSNLAYLDKGICYFTLGSNVKSQAQCHKNLSLIQIMYTLHYSKVTTTLLNMFIKKITLLNIRPSTENVSNIKYLTYLTHQIPKNLHYVMWCSKSYNFCHMWTVPF